MKTLFGKGMFCKNKFSKATLAAAVARMTLVAASTAHAAACSNASLKGKYGQTMVPLKEKRSGHDSSVSLFAPI
jgi:hypothetical protein